MYDERFRIMVFTVLDNIKNIQASEAQSNASARLKALGYNETSTYNSSSSSSACSVSTLVPLVVANNIFDRGTKRKLRVQKSKGLKRKKDKIYYDLILISFSFFPI